MKLIYLCKILTQEKKSKKQLIVKFISHKAELVFNNKTRNRRKKKTFSRQN